MCWRWRVWKAPLDSFDTGLEGGLAAPPLAGSAAALVDRKTDFDYQWLRSRQYLFALNSLNFLVMALSLLAWLRGRSQKLLLWMSLYALTPILTLLLVGLHMPWSYRFALGWLQPVHAMGDISLWLLLLWLLRLTENRVLVRLAVWLCWIDLVANVLDGALTLVDWTNPAAVGWEQGADGFLTIFETVPELFPLLLVGFALRKRLDLARLAGGHLCLQLVTHLQFPHRRVAGKPLHPLDPGANHQCAALHRPGQSPHADNPGQHRAAAVSGLCGIPLHREAALRQGALEQELRSAQELQQVLIPELLPSLSGYSVTSAYVPAQQVGGDFFQVIPAGPGGASWLVLGDVSGKGLRAAMTVSLIVGMLRTLTDFTVQPAEVLAGLNRRLTDDCTEALLLAW